MNDTEESPSVFKDIQITGQEEAVMMNDLDDHYVCCNRKRVYVDSMKNNYGMLRVTRDGSELSIPATLIDVSNCDELNDNDRHEIHYLNIHTGDMECVDIESTVEFTYTVSDTTEDQHEEMNRTLASRRGLSRNITGEVREKIMYSTAPVYMIRLAVVLQTDKIYDNFGMMLTDLGIDNIKDRWIEVVKVSRNSAQKTLAIEKEDAIKENDDLTFAEIEVIEDMLDKVIKETREVLKGFKDPEQVVSYWPPILLPAPSYVLPPDVYQRYLSKIEA